MNISDNLGQSYIQTQLDTGSVTTRSFPGPVTDSDFTLNYLTVESKNWDYNDTTKIFTYNGSRSAVYSFTYNVSIQRTDTGGSPIMELSVKREPLAGGGYTIIPLTYSYRQFTGSDVGFVGGDVMFTVNPGDKFKMNVSVDATMDVDIRNLTVHFHATDTNP